MLTVQKNAQRHLPVRRIAASAPSRCSLLDFLRSRIAAHATAGDLDAWVHQTLTQDITDQLGGPTFAALADFTAKVETDPDARNQLYGLLAVPRRRGGQRSGLPDRAHHARRSGADVPRRSRPRAGGAHDRRGARSADAAPSTRSSRSSSARTISTPTRRSSPSRSNLYKQDADGDLSGVEPRRHPERAQPRAARAVGGPLDGADYQSILGEVQGFLIDDQRGFTRFLNIVKARGPH